MKSSAALTPGGFSTTEVYAGEVGRPLAFLGQAQWRFPSASASSSEITISRGCGTFKTSSASSSPLSPRSRVTVASPRVRSSPATTPSMGWKVAAAAVLLLSGERGWWAASTPRTSTPMLRSTSALVGPWTTSDATGLSAGGASGSGFAGTRRSLGSFMSGAWAGDSPWRGPAWSLPLWASTTSRVSSPPVTASSVSRSAESGRVPAQTSDGDCWSAASDSRKSPCSRRYTSVQLVSSPSCGGPSVEVPAVRSPSSRMVSAMRAGLALFNCQRSPGLSAGLVSKSAKASLAPRMTCLSVRPGLPCSVAVAPWLTTGPPSVGSSGSPDLSDRAFVRAARFEVQ